MATIGDSPSEPKAQPQSPPTSKTSSPGGPDGSTPRPAPAKSGPEASQSSSRLTASGPSTDPRGQSGLTESLLVKSILRKGLATAEEVAAAKAYQAKLAGTPDAGKGLLEILVAGKALTTGQAQRLLREVGAEAQAQRKLEIPGYTHFERLGKGSMGIVFKAKQASMDRTVAIKVLLDGLAQNKEFIQRFQREAKIAAKLSHNHIVNAIDAGEAGGRYYFVMEYVEGINIKDELEKGKIYEEKEAIRIITAVAEALKHAHERGLIHRDVKPENIILTKEGQVKLADLGLARLTADEQQAMSEAGMAIGTPYYISPEQVRGQVDVDIRGDIYSLGATLYHMVTGRPPFDGETPAEVMKKHIDKKQEVIPPDHLNTRLSGGLGEVIETMMARNRDDRYRTPDDLLLDLKCVAQGDRPIIASRQRADDLAELAEGDAADTDETPQGGPTDSELADLASVVNNRNNIIATLGILLAVSVVSNLLLLVVGR